VIKSPASLTILQVIFFLLEFIAIDKLQKAGDKRKSKKTSW